MRAKTRLIIYSSILLFFILLVTGYILILNQNPLYMDGYTEYNNERKKIDISLMNHGLMAIKLLSVQINDNQSPTDVKLVASYDSQLVAGGIDHNEKAQFLDIHELSIFPHLSYEEMKRAMETEDRPVNYGLRITSEEDIHSIEIKYKYFGITKTKTIKLDSWNESNI